VVETIVDVRIEDGSITCVAVTMMNRAVVVPPITGVVVSTIT
jgi:hypothetical protein